MHNKKQIAFAAVVFLSVLASFQGNRSLISSCATITSKDSAAVASAALTLQSGVSAPVIMPNICQSANGSEFDNIYTNGKWAPKMQTIHDFYSNGDWPPKKRASGSGTGSDLGYFTVESMAILRRVITEFGVNTMIDIPCGDVNWILDSWETDSMELYILAWMLSNQ